MEEDIKESKTLKQSIIELALNKLNNCKSFRKAIGGEEFINKQFDRYLDKAYIGNKSLENHLGEYRMGENSIVIFTKEDNIIPDVALHESIHCILTRKNGKNLSTGIHNVYGDIERGRGLNEGFTEWIVDKAGMSGKAYTDEKKIVEQLELAFGENQIMRFARGDIKREIPRILGISRDECRIFLNKVDLFANCREHLRNNKIILKELQDNTSLEEIKNNQIYKNRINDQEYTDYLKEFKLEDNRESQIKFFTKLKKYYLDNYVKMKYNIRHELYNTYFKKEFEGLENKKKLTVKQSKKYIHKYDQYFKIVFDGSFFKFSKKEFDYEIEGIK